MPRIMIEDNAEQVYKDYGTTAPEIEEQTGNEQIEIAEFRGGEKIAGQDQGQKAKQENVRAENHIRPVGQLPS